MCDRAVTLFRPTTARAAVAIALAGLLLGCQGCRTADAPPRDYYFSAQGDDAAGAGTLDRPFKSIARANKLRLNPGDRVLFRGGDTFAGNLMLDAGDAGTPERPVTIASYDAAGGAAAGPGGARATISAGIGNGVRVESAGGVRVADLVVVGAGRQANGGNGVEFVNTLPRGRRLKHVRVENVEVRGFGKEGVFVHGRPSDASASGYDDVRVADCVARGNGHTGVYVAGYWKAQHGKPPHDYAHHNVRVVRCLAADNAGDPRARRENRSGSGILLDSVDGGLVEHCEATNNGSDNRALRGGPVGIWCTIATNVVVQYNKSHRNRTGAGHDGGGFCLDGGVHNSVLQYNLSEENDGCGYGLFQYAGAPPAFANTVRHNVSRSDGRRNGYAAIHVWDDARGLRDLRIHHNEVHVTAAAASGEKPPRAIWIQSPVRNCRVSDNLFVVGANARVMDVAYGQRQIRFENNTYRTNGDRVAMAWEGTPYTSLAFWRQTTGQDAVRSADAE